MQFRVTTPFLKEAILVTLKLVSKIIKINLIGANPLLKIYLKNLKSIQSRSSVELSLFEKFSFPSGKSCYSVPVVSQPFFLQRDYLEIRQWLWGNSADSDLGDNFFQVTIVQKKSLVQDFNIGKPQCSSTSGRLGKNQDVESFKIMFLTLRTRIECNWSDFMCPSKWIIMNNL